MFGSSPKPPVVKQPKFTWVKEPTLLCNHLPIESYNEQRPAEVTFLLEYVWRMTSGLG
jgi:hypothetical protein